MPITNITYEILLTAGGGTISLPVTDPYTLYNVATSGSVTLTSNWTIQPSGPPSDGMLFHFKYQADITPDGNTITIFGETMPETLYDKTCTITASYTSGAWEVDFHADLGEDGSIPLTMLSGGGWKEMPTTAEPMMNGDDSPVLINAPQSEGTTNSLLFYKLDATSKTIEISGRVEVNSVNETTVSGSLKVIIATIDPGNTGLTTPLGLLWVAPIAARYQTSGGESIKSAYITKGATFSGLELEVSASELGTDTNATYSAYIHLVIPYV